MRYLIAENQSKEIAARQKYLYDIFQLYFIPQNPVDGFIPLVPLGTAEFYVIFIVGHYDQVRKYLKSNIRNIEEGTIVLITCYASKLKRFKKNDKVWFVSTAENELSYCYRGKDYGFEFDITESEIDFYNCSKLEVMERIEKCFQRL